MHLIKIFEKTRQELLAKQRSESPIRVKKAERYSVTQVNIDPNAFINNWFVLDCHIAGGHKNYKNYISFQNVMTDLIESAKNDSKHFINSRLIQSSIKKSLDTNDIYIDCDCEDFCLHPTTKIKLITGEVCTIEKLKTKFDDNDNIWIYSVDKHGKVIPTKVINIWITKKESKFIKITLDNDNEIITTYNHMYKLKNGRYKEAKDLKIGQQLMTLLINNKTGDIVSNKRSHSIKQSIIDTLCKLSIFKHIKLQTNCKIKNILYLELNEPINVYDLEVLQHNNFYVDAGAILHNCYRYAYWATRNKFKWGKLQNSNGQQIRNPDDNIGSMCKHSYALLQSNTFINHISDKCMRIIMANIDILVKRFDINLEEFIINVSHYDRLLKQQQARDNKGKFTSNSNNEEQNIANTEPTKDENIDKEEDIDESENKETI